MMGVVLATCPRFGACFAVWLAACCCAAWLPFCVASVWLKRSSISCCCLICCCCAAICFCCAARASRSSLTSFSVIPAGVLLVSDAGLAELPLCAKLSAESSSTAAHHLRTGFILCVCSPVAMQSLPSWWNLLPTENLECRSNFVELQPYYRCVNI